MLPSHSQWSYCTQGCLRREVPRLVHRLLTTFHSQRWLDRWKAITHCWIFKFLFTISFTSWRVMTGTYCLLFGFYSMQRFCIFGNIWYSNLANLTKIKVGEKKVKPHHIILQFLQSNPNIMYIFAIPNQSSLWLKHPTALVSALKEVL